LTRVLAAFLQHVIPAGFPRICYFGLLGERDEDEVRGFWNRIVMQMAASQGIANMFVDMSDALNSGNVRALEARSQRNTTPTSYEQFVAEEFVPAYQATSAGATSARA
jgi:hypothetical protein